METTITPELAFAVKHNMTLYHNKRWYTVCEKPAMLPLCQWHQPEIVVSLTVWLQLPRCLPWILTRSLVPRRSLGAGRLGCPGMLDTCQTGQTGLVPARERERYISLVVKGSWNNYRRYPTIHESLIPAS